jgi:hypothetical protein
VADETEKRAGPKSDGNSANARDKVEQSARREALGTGLRRAYQKVLNEPIPDEFSALLDKLSDSDSGREQK